MENTTTAGAVEQLALPRLLDRPERCPGTYSMHFYCKYVNPDHPWQPGGNYMEEAVDVETRAAAIAQMRRGGWIYHRDGTATCDRCAKALKGPQP